MRYNLLLVAVVARRLFGDEPRASNDREFRALSMAVMSSGPTECDRRARSNSLTGMDATRFAGSLFCADSSLAAGGTW